MYHWQVFKKPVFLINFPKEIKSFYMKVNPDGKVRNIGADARPCAPEALLATSCGVANARVSVGMCFAEMPVCVA